MSEPASLGGLGVERASLVVPSWGIWTADVQVASGDLLAGPTTLELGGVEWAGTIVSGGVYRERGWYRVVGGSGGWRNTIPALSYRNEAGVKLSQVLGAAARAAGEELATFTDRRIGPAYECPIAEASRSLDLLSREAWYVDEDGVTHLGARAESEFTGSYTIDSNNPSRGLLTIAAEDITGLAPGATIEGVTVASVRHEHTPDKIRSHVWSTQESLGDRLGTAFRMLVGAFTRSTFYHGRYEYRVETASGTHLDLRPARSSVGLPSLANVPMRAGSPGATGTPAIGSSCEVQFLDGDPTRPVVVGFDSTEPTSATITAAGSVNVGDGADHAIARGDVTEAYLAGILTALGTAGPIVGPLDAGIKSAVAAAFPTLTPGILTPGPSPSTSGPGKVP